MPLKAGPPPPPLHPRTTMRYCRGHSASDNSDVIVPFKKESGLVISRRKTKLFTCPRCISRGGGDREKSKLIDNVECNYLLTERIFPSDSVEMYLLLVLCLITCDPKFCGRVCM